MKNKKVISWILYMIPIVLIFSFILLVHFPGIVNVDTTVQWNQIQTNNYSDWHPIMNTLYMKALTVISNTPQFIAFVQILIISMIVSYALTRIEKYYGIKRLYLLIVAILFALFPINFNYSVTLLKDILYSMFILLFTAFVFDILNNENWLKKWYNIVFLVIDLFVIAAFRHNGIIVVIFSLLMLAIILKEQRLRIIITAVSWIAIYVIATYSVNVILNVEKATYANKYAPISHLFADMLNNNKVIFTSDDLEILEKYVDVQKLKETYNPYNMDYSINCQNILAIKEDPKSYVKLCILKCLEYPDIFINHYLMLGEYLFSPFPFNGDSAVIGITASSNLFVYGDKYPYLAENSKIPALLPLVQKIEKRLDYGFIGGLFKRPALWMYLTILMIILAMKKHRNNKLWLILIPSISNIFSLWPAMPVPSVRYVYATMLVAWIIIPFGIFTILKKERLLLNEKREEST